MAFRPDIVAGKAVILVNIEDTIDKQLRQIRSKLRRFSNSLSDIGGDLFRGGSAGLIGAIFPVKEFIDFQDQLLFIQTKLQATDFEMMGLENTIRQLGKSTSFTSREVGQAAQQFAQAGFSLAEVNDSLQASLDLARGGQVPLETATGILARSLRTFGKDASFASDFASKFIAAARLGTLDIIDLNESLKEVSGTFRGLNVDIEGALGLITQLSLSSLIGTKAGTSLNTAFINITKNAELLQEKLGIRFTSLSDPVAVFRELGDALKGLSDFERVATLNEIFNIRGGRAATAVLIQGLDNLDDRIRQIRGSMDEARISAEKLDSRLGGVFRRARSSFQEFLLAAGGTSEGPLTDFGEAVRKAFNELSSLSQKNPELLQTLFLLPPIALSAGVAFLGLAFALNKVASAMTPLISLNSLLFKGLVGIVGGNRDAFSQFGKGGKSLLGLTALSGKGKKASSVRNIGLTTRAISGLTSQLTKLKTIAASPALRPFLARGGLLARGVAMMAQSAYQVASGFPTVHTAGRGIGGARRVGQAFSGLPQAIASVMTKKRSWKPLQMAVSRGLIDGSAKAADAVEKIFRSRTFRGLTLMGQGIMGRSATRNLGIQTSFARLRGGTKLFASGSLAQGAKAGAIGLSKTIATIATKLPSAIKGITTFTRGVFVGLNAVRRFVFSFSGILTIIEALIIFGPKFKPIREFFESFGQFFEKIASAGPFLSEAIRNLVAGVKQLFGGDLSNGVRTMKEALDDMVFIVKVKLSNAWKQLKRDIHPVIEAVKEVVHSIKEVFTALVDTISIVGGAAANKVVKGASNVFGGEGGTSFKSVVETIAKGIIEGIKAVAVGLLSILGWIATILEDIRMSIRSFVESYTGKTLTKYVNPGGYFAQQGILAGAGQGDTTLGLGEAIVAAIKRVQGISFTSRTPQDAPLPGDIDEEAAIQYRIQKRAFEKLSGLTEGPLVDVGKAIVDGMIRGLKEPLYQKVFAGRNEKQLEEFFKPEVDLVNRALGQLEASGIILDMKRAREAREKLPEEEKLEVVLDKLTSVVGSFSSTRGQLFKLFTRNEELDTLKDIEVNTRKEDGELPFN